MIPSASARVNDLEKATETCSTTPQDVPSADEALRHVRVVTKEAGSSFYWAMRILPAERRDAMFAIYAFCREVDDIADGPDPADVKLTELQRWRTEIDRVYDSMPTTLTARALVEPSTKFGLRREDFIAVIEGMEMDALGVAKGPRLEELETYCARVAGAVGLLSIRAFGATGTRIEEFAMALGKALQLTNILRDLEDDSSLGRLYLPHELLERHGIDARAPNDVLSHPNLPKVCEELAAMAYRRYEQAEDALRDCSASALRPAIVMMVNYRRILERLIRRGWRELDRPVGVSKLEKIWIALRYGMF